MSQRLLKDELGIPDHKWGYFVDIMQVEGATIGKVKRLQHEWNGTLDPQKTLGGKGSEIDILTLLQFYQTRDWNNGTKLGRKGFERMQILKRRATTINSNNSLSLFVI
eukprot:TRINITY_DN8276_c0_g1_i11.p2 TRINITY_DN8276_c0_g1~~TRINITY_DN8276_c0_g1_i11.p2  ORF type:complete len:108 (-),score=21.56 TRINITY_DN8276_c0_g1_i11:1640-1963(-)